MPSDELFSFANETTIYFNNKKFRFLVYRGVKQGRQELVLVRLPVPMRAGRELWELTRATEAELKSKLNLDAISTLGAVTNTVMTSTMAIQAAGYSNVLLIARD